MASTAPAPFAPPPGFEEVESRVPGVRVFAPRAKDEAPDDPAVFRCPRCGGTTRFEVRTQGVTCPYCDYVDAPAARVVGRAAEAHEFTIEALHRAAHGWGVDREELHCDGCGADLALDPGALAATCPFCLSSRVRKRSREDSGLRPRFVIPFAVESAELRDRARRWLAKGWMHPAALRKLGSIESFTGIYLPYWTFSARLASGWRAEVGHEETTTEYDHSSGTWKTRTRTVWHWESGRAATAVRDLLVPGTGHLDGKLLRAVGGFDLAAFAEYAPAWLAGWQALSYDVGLLEAWDDGKHTMREQARQDCLAQCSTAKVRSFSMTSDLDDEQWRYVLLPVWVSTYRFERRTWQVMVNGQTGEIVGNKPVAWWKIWGVIALMLLPGLGTLLVSVPLLFLGVGLVTIVVGVVLLVAAIPFATALHARARAAEGL